MGFERIVDALMHDRYPDGACAKAPGATVAAAPDGGASGDTAAPDEMSGVDPPDSAAPDTANDREVTAP